MSSLNKDSYKELEIHQSPDGDGKKTNKKMSGGTKKKPSKKTLKKSSKKMSSSVKKM